MLEKLIDNRWEKTSMSDIFRSWKSNDEDGNTEFICTTPPDFNSNNPYLDNCNAIYTKTRKL